MIIKCPDLHSASDIIGLPNTIGRKPSFGVQQREELRPSQETSCHTERNSQWLLRLDSTISDLESMPALRNSRHQVVAGKTRNAHESRPGNLVGDR